MFYKHYLQTTIHTQQDRTNLTLTPEWNIHCVVHKVFT